MSEYGTTPPPFATPLCTPLVLYGRLILLDDWVSPFRDWADEEARRFKAPDDPFIPMTPTIPSDSSSLLGVSIPSLYRTWLTIRQVRERWDWILRIYEEHWDNDKCIFSRIMCVKTAALALREAFLDPEKHEALMEVRKNKEQMVEALKQIGTTEEILNAMGLVPNDEEEIDFDSLFNPEGDQE